MSLVNPALISDVHYEYVENRDDLSKYYATVDRNIQAMCIANRVPVPSIPLDDDDYVESLILQQYGLALLQYEVFKGYWGTRAGKDDIYYRKREEMLLEVDRWERKITYDTIMGFDVDDTVAETAYAGIKQSAY